MIKKDIQKLDKKRQDYFLELEKIKNKYNTTAELTKTLKISRVAVWKRIKTGKIKAVKFGRNYICEKVND